MAKLIARLALFGTLTLLDSGCTLHVVSGPVSHQRADNGYYSSMTPARAQGARPAPRPLAQARRSEPHPTRAARPVAMTRDERRVARRAADPVDVSAAREGGKPTNTGGDERQSLHERRRMADVRQRVRDSRRPDASETAQSPAANDDSRHVKFPYWVSTNDGTRIDLDGSQVRSERRPGAPQASR